MSEVTPAAAEAPPQEKPSNPFSRIVGVFVSPSSTFADIARRPDWIVPILLLLLVSYTSVFMIAGKVDFNTVYRQALEAQHMAPEQQERALRIATTVGKSIMYVAPFFSIGGLVIAAALLFLGLRMLGGQLTFLQSFAVTAYAWMPHVLAGIIGVIVSLSRKTIGIEDMQTLVHSSPAFLVSMKTNPVLFNFLSTIDLFSIWVIVLLTIGLSIAARVSKAKAFAVVITLWAMYVLFRVGQGALAAMRMRAQA
jgi:hypothetical protein